MALMRGRRSRMALVIMTTIAVMLDTGCFGAAATNTTVPPAGDSSGISSSDHQSQSNTKAPACLQILKDNEKPPRFEQFTERENMFSELTRRLIQGARKHDRANPQISIDVKGEDIQDKVGYHVLRARTRAGCYEIAYEIVDVDECANPSLSGCHASTVCRNTNGSFECECKPNMVGLYGQCAGFTTTGPGGCDCQTLHCKRGLICAVPDKCGGRCASEATCDDGVCRCPAGTFGSGIICNQDQRQLQAVFDQNGTLHGPSKHEDDYCGCQARKVDYCLGVHCRPHSVCRSVNGSTTHSCVCEEGFVDEGGECVDTRGVRLVLLGDATMELEQGDSFDDPFVRIKDENQMGDRMRKIVFMYDPQLNNDTLDEVGEFKANYGIQANWTREKQVSVTRRVIVKDIDECSLKPSHPKYKRWHHVCVPESRCVNTVGGYECRCPEGAVGDGTMGGVSPQHMRPTNYRDGSGCKDMRPPIIEVLAPPRVFRVCKCEGLGSGEGGVPPAGVVNCPRRDYQRELQTLIDQDKSFLCSSGGGNQQQQMAGGGGKGGKSLCFKAYKRSWDPSKVTDLTKEASIGPVQLVKSSGNTFLFRVPIDVTDAQGIGAETQHVQIKVEEVPLAALAGKEAATAAASPSESQLAAAAQEVKEYKRQAEEYKQKAVALGLQVKQLEEEKAKAAASSSPYAGAAGEVQASLLQKKAEGLEHKLSACESRYKQQQQQQQAQEASSKKSSVEREGACPAAEPGGGVSPGSSSGSSSNGMESISSAKALGFLAFALLSLTAIIFLICRGAQQATELERQQAQAPAPNSRWQESPAPSRTRAPDRTPGSPVRPYRGHVNLRSPLLSPGL